VGPSPQGTEDEAREDTAGPRRREEKAVRGDQQQLSTQRKRAELWLLMSLEVSGT
jgi:hypothetical protein